MTISLRNRLACLAVVLIAVPGLGAAASVASDEPTMKPVGAALVYQQWKDDNCHWTIGVVFGNAPGAESYLISYWDGYYRQVTTQSVPAKDVDAGILPPQRKFIPKGKHYVSATGGNGGGADCKLDDNPDPTEGGRFSKGAKAFAVFPAGKKARRVHISGTVEEISCSEAGCTHKGLDGVSVSAAGAAGGSATTGDGGHYSIEVKQGLYRVTPSLSGREFEPVSSEVTAGKSGASASFVTCAATRTTQSASAAAGDPCPKIALDVSRVKLGDGVGWTQTSGKKFLPAGDVRVGFTTPHKDGDFARHCVTGCFNVRLAITDAKTHHFIPNAHVVVTAKLGAKAVTPFAKDGAFCRAGDAIPLDTGCAHTLDVTLENQRTLDFYYWAPGVIEPTSVVLSISVKSPKYPKETKKTVELTIKPNVAFAGEYTVQPGALLHLNTLAPIIFATGKIDIADYCGYAAKSLIKMSEAHFPAGLRQALLKSTQLMSKAFKSGCSVVEMGAIIPKLKPVTGWILYWFFQDRLRVPPSGLVGNPRLINWGAQLALEYSGFFDEFLNGLQAWVYDGFDPADPDASLARADDHIKIKIYEVSYRGPSSRFGTVQDALYLTMSGTKRGEPVKTFGAYVEGGYWPGCWLDPKLNREEFWLPVGTNPCNLDDA
jgi:hypothetical protein